MNLWIDKKNHATHDWLRKWTWVVNIPNAISVIKCRANSDDPVTLISVNADMAEEFLEALSKLGGIYEVALHDGEPTARCTQLITQYHWDKKVMDNRTAELIMVLKGKHNLRDELPSILPPLGVYLQDVALYLSDDCDCPFSEYVQHPTYITDAIHTAVIDYTKACDNPAGLLWQYFEYKRMHGDKYTDEQCWCAALAMCQVRNNNKYINGFNERNTKRYTRQRPFRP